MTPNFEAILPNSIVKVENLLSPHLLFLLAQTTVPVTDVRESWKVKSNTFLAKGILIIILQSHVGYGSTLNSYKTCRAIKQKEKMNWDCMN
jgi:hypothetical protein